MWLGGCNTANATNRVGAIFQTTMYHSLNKTNRVKYMIRRFLSSPILIGAIIGANFAVDIRKYFKSLHWSCNDWFAHYYAFKSKEMVDTNRRVTKRKHPNYGRLLGLALWWFIQRGLIFFYPSSHGKICT